MRFGGLISEKNVFETKGLTCYNKSIDTLFKNRARDYALTKTPEKRPTHLR